MLTKDSEKIRGKQKIIQPDFFFEQWIHVFVQVKNGKVEVYINGKKIKKS
jgi:hypothetical protein